MDSLHNVLIIESNPHLEALFSLNLEVYVNVKASSKQLAEFAISYMEKEHFIPELIITRDEIKAEKTASDIFKYLKSIESDIPVIIIGSKEIDHGRKNVAQITSCLNLKEIIKNTSRFLGVTAESMVKKEVDENFPIPIIFFKNIKLMVCDIFLEDLDGQGKFKHKFSKGDVLGDTEISELMEGGYNSLYVEKSNRLKVINSISEEIIFKLESGDLSLEEKLVYSDKMLGSLGKKLLRNGFDAETIVMTKNLIHSVKNISRKETRLSKLIKNLLSNEASYRYKHVQLISYFGLRVIEGSDWGSKKQEEKFLFAATLHDIGLTNDEHVKIHTAEELKEANHLSDEEKDKILNHARDASRLIQSCPKAPIGVENVIMKHHGSVTGVGFADYASTTMTPIELAFYVCEEYARLILDMPSDEINYELAAEKLKDIFPTGRFKKITQILELIKA